MEKKAKFFCENCGAEVPSNAKMCRHCGRFFSSVRCPVCGATGTNSQFASGCPVCGYAVGKGPEISSQSKGEKGIQKEKKAGRKARAKLREEIESRNQKNFSKKKSSDETLPVFFFLIIAIVFFAFLAVTAKYLKIW